MTRREKVDNTNDGSALKPRLKCYMNLASLEGMAEALLAAIDSDPHAALTFLKESGFEGVQFSTPSGENTRTSCRAIGLGMAGSGRINDPADATRLISMFESEGMECGTVHVGWGMEDNDDCYKLIEAVLGESARIGVPVYVETHRATIFQDMWRTVQFIKRFPELRFNGDFSHWYTGLEMVYGGFEKKLLFIAPVLERVRFLHGRIGNPGSIQVSVAEKRTQQPAFVEHFRQMWTASMRGFLASAGSGDYLCFAPELLPSRIFYARTFENDAGEMEEESDRWEQSLLLTRIAKDCFAQCEATA